GAKWEEFSTRTNPTFFKDNMFSSITVGNDDRIWIGTSNKGILVYNGISWINFDINAMGLDPLMGNNVSEIKSDGKGKIWIGLVPNMKFQNIRGGIVEFDGVKWKEVKFSGIGVTLFQDFYFYKGKGYLSTQSGFAIFDESYNIDLYNIFNSKIPTADIRAIKRDKSGALWLVTMNGAMKIKNIPN
ncbi:MAG: two-component regulator propeller domain-containing protein, partial [Melioribacteraceae bacterium]